MMQRYRSHKLVEAGRIQGISYNAAGEPCSMQVGGRQYAVPNDILIRAPSLGVGDYLVKYADGYLSASPTISTSWSRGRALPKQLGADLTSDDLFAIKAKLGEAMALVCELIGRQNARENRKMKR